MIFGKSYAEKRLARRQAVSALLGTRRVFAWLPVKLWGGRYAWLETVERYGFQTDYHGDLVHFRYFRA